MVLVTNEDRFGKPGGPTAEVALTIAGHTHTFTVSEWKRNPGNPYIYDEIAEKFRRFAVSCLSADRIEKIIQKVMALEKIGDVVELTSLIRED